MRSVESPVSSGVRATKSLECHPPHNPSSVVRIDESLSPASLDSVVIAERDTTKNEKFSSGGSPINSVEADQLMQDLPIRPGNHGIGTTAFSTPNPYVPLYVTLAVSKFFIFFFFFFCAF